MANKYFKPNWHAINKAMETKEGRGDIRKDLKELTKKVDEKLTAKWREEQISNEAARVKAIKILPAGSDLWFTGNWLKLVGKKGQKVKDGRTRVVIDFGEHGKWNCLYTQTTSTEPNATVMNVKKNIIKILET